VFSIKVSTAFLMSTVLTREKKAITAYAIDLFFQFIYHGKSIG